MQGMKNILEAGEHKQKLVKHTEIQLNRTDIGKAKTIDWMSITLNNTLPIFEYEITQCLKNNGQIRILLVDPYSSVPESLARLGYSLGKSDRIISKINSTMDMVEHWKQTIPNCSLEVRYLCSQPPYRMTIIDRSLSTGSIQIRLFVVPRSGEIPTVRLRATEDNEWYKFMIDQFEKYWAMSKPTHSMKIK